MSLLKKNKKEIERSSSGSDSGSVGLDQQKKEKPLFVSAL